MIICFSTSPGNPSIRTQQGSPFITEFCEVVNDNPDCTIYQEKIIFLLSQQFNFYHIICFVNNPNKIMHNVIANMKTRTYLVRTKDEKIRTKISPQFSSSLSKDLYLRRSQPPAKRPLGLNFYVDKDPKMPRREDDKVLKRDLSLTSITSAEISDLGSIAMNSTTSSRCETPMSFLLSEDDFQCAETNFAHNLTKFSIETLIRSLYGVLVHDKSYDEIQLSYHSIIRSGKFILFIFFFIFI